MKKLKALLKDYWLLIPIGIYALIWMIIMSETAHSQCEGVGLINAKGPCLIRSLAGLSCFAIYLAAWTVLGGIVAVSKRRSRLLGCILGFTLQFIGCIFMLTWDIKYNCPRCGKRVKSEGLCDECRWGRTPTK
jgi:hypothetical protein